MKEYRLNHRFSVFNVGCGPRSILMPDAKPVVECYYYTLYSPGAEFKILIFALL